MGFEYVGHILEVTFGEGVGLGLKKEMRYVRMAVHCFEGIWEGKGSVAVSRVVCSVSGVRDGEPSFRS
jgi:hypothetical protein